MNIVFRSVRMKNFVAVGDEWLEIQLDRNPTTVVYGHNGACKSGAMLDSLCFCLYGKPFKPIKIGDLVNNKNNKGMMVEVIFSKGASTYKVERGYKPKHFKIYKDDNPLPDTNLNQETLEEILGIPFNTFKQMVVTGKTNYQSFMDLSKDKRREFVESLLDISIIRAMADINKKRETQYTAQRNEAVQQFNTVNESIRITVNAIDTLETVIHKSKMDQILSIQKEIKNHREQISYLRNEYAKFEKDASLTLEKELKEKLQKCHDVKVASEFQVSEIVKEVEFFLNNDTCPTCHQSITQELKDEKLSQGKQSVKSKKESLKKLETIISKLKEQHKKVSDAIHNVNLLEREIKAEETAIAKLERDINAIKAEKSESDTAAIEKQKQELSRLNELHKHWQDEINTFDQHIAKVKDAKFMLGDKGIKAIIIRKYLNVINQLINENLSHLGLFATLKFDEEWKEEIKKRGFDDFSFYQLSEGEKLRVDLSIMLAWRELASLRSGLSINLLVMDEIFNTSMDYSGCKALMELLNAKEGQNTFIVSPNAEDIIDMAYSSIELKKNEFGFTIIV